MISIESQLADDEQSLPQRRRVLLLQTDERAGLVASIADACAKRGVSLEIATGPGHVMIACSADDDRLEDLASAFRETAGVADVHTYSVESAYG